MSHRRGPLPMLATLWRIALRNARRHKAQAWAASAAVAVGVTVLAASLAAGQAAQAGITQVAFDILDETDEMVRTEGDFFFPQEAADRFAREVARRDASLSVSPALTHISTASTPEGLTEPDTLLVGFPRQERGFGSFEAIAGAGTLAGQGVLVNEDLATALDLAPGDTLRARYALPVDPFVPTVLQYRGNVTSASAPGPVPGLPGLPTGPAQATAETFEIDVEPGTTRMVGVLLWGSAGNVTDLDLALVAPNGTRYENTTGTTGDPEVPAILDVPVDEGGAWQAQVTAKAAAEQPFRLVVVLLRPAFTIEDLRQGREALEELGPLGEQLRQARGGSQVAELTVAGVVSGEGKGGFLGEPAVFLPLEELQELLERRGEVNLVRISNPGGPRDGLAYTDQAMPALRDALNATQAGFDAPSVQALQVEATKANVVDRAERAGAQFTRFLTTLSSFTIVAGILLVVNLFTMLGEERRVELSVMRATGMQRRHLVGSMTLEGTLYALPGAPVGGVLGLGLAFVLIKAVNDFVTSQDAIPIPFVVEWWTPLLAAAIGLAFTVLAVAFTGWRLSRLHIASGLKGLQDPEASGTKRWLPWALVGAGGLTTAAFWPTGLYTLLILGPAALLYGAALWIGRSWSGHLARFLGAALVLPYELWTILAYVDIPSWEVPYVAPTRGTLMVLMGVVLLLNLPGLPRLLKGTARRLGRWAPSTMVALAYPIKRQTRTGLTASMFALVLLVLAVFSSFFNVFQVDPAKEAGGYDIYAETNLPVEDLDAWAQRNLDQRPASLDRVGLVDDLAVVRVVGGDIVTIQGQEVNYNGPPVDWFYGIDQGFAEHNGYELASRADRFPTDQAAYTAVAGDPSLVLLSRTYDVDEAGRLGRIQGGERVTVDLVSGTVNLTAAGAQEQVYLSGMFLQRQVVEDLFPTHGSGFLIQVEPGQDPEAVAKALEADFQELGLNVESIRAEALELQELNARFFTVLQVFLGLGLVIGAASVGIVTAKSALEREHELGVMRAMGMSKRQITWSLVSESLFTAILGVIPGIVIGVAVSYAAYVAFFAGAGVPFTVPWSSIFWLSLISLLAALASTVLPARRAARTDVAQAVRVRF